LKSELTLGFKDYTTALIILTMYIMLDDMYVTMPISIGLYRNLDLWTANKLQ